MTKPITRALLVELAKPLGQTWDEVGPVLRGLRAQSHRALNAAVVGCVVADHLEAAGHRTFAGFLASAHLCSENRYERFKRGWSVLGTETAVQIGEHATVESAAFREPTPERREQIIERARAFVAETGVAPSQQTAERWRRDCDAAPEPRVRRTDRVAELEAENRKLRAELKAANALVKKLEAQLRRVKPAAGQPTRQEAAT